MAGVGPLLLIVLNCLDGDGDDMTVTHLNPYILFVCSSALLDAIMKQMGQGRNRDASDALGDNDSDDDGGDSSASGLTTAALGKRAASRSLSGLGGASMSSLRSTRSRAQGMGGGGAGLERILEELQREITGLKHSVTAITRHHGILADTASLTGEESEGRLLQGGGIKRRPSGLNNVMFAADIDSQAGRGSGAGNGAFSRSASLARGGVLSRAASHRAPSLRAAPSLTLAGSKELAPAAAPPVGNGPMRRSSVVKPEASGGSFTASPSTRRPSMSLTSRPSPMRRPSTIGYAPQVMAAITPRKSLEETMEEVRAQPRPPRPGHERSGTQQAASAAALSTTALRDSAKTDSADGSGSSRTDAVSSVTNALRLLSMDYDRALQMRQQTPHAAAKKSAGAAKPALKSPRGLQQQPSLETVDSPLSLLPQKDQKLQHNMVHPPSEQLKTAGSSSSQQSGGPPPPAKESPRLPVEAVTGLSVPPVGINSKQQSSDEPSDVGSEGDDIEKGQQGSQGS